MPKGTNNRGEKQVGAWLPKPFVEKFKGFVKALNAGNDGIRKVTEREVIYEALVEKMEREKAKVAQSK